MGKFNSINDAIRQKIDDLVENNSLDHSKYLYTTDVVSSLNQLTRAFGGEPESTTIADALYESLDSAGSGGGGLDGYKLIDGSYSGENGEIVIPAGKISHIGDFGLAGTLATKIDLKDSGITRISLYGLSNNPFLTEIVFPDDLESIAAYCFYDDVNITDISYNSNVTIALDKTFSGCRNLVSLPILTLPESETFISSNAFGGCIKLKKVIVTNPTIIYSGAFGSCIELEYIYLGPTVTRIDSGAFGSVPITCKVRCGFSEGAISGFPANGGWAGNPNDLDIEYDVPVPTEYPED